MNPGDWVIFIHMTSAGTCIYPKIRKIKSVDRGYINLDTDVFPRTVRGENIISSFSNPKEAKTALERGFSSWASMEEKVKLLEQKAEAARSERLKSAISAVKGGDNNGR